MYANEFKTLKEKQKTTEIKKSTATLTFTIRGITINLIFLFTEEIYTTVRLTE